MTSASRTERSERVFANPPGLLAPPGPYSQVVRAGDLVFVSGQVGADADDVLAGPGVHAQIDQALTNIRVALESQGLGLEHVVKLTLFLRHEEDIAGVGRHTTEVFPLLFPAGLPASTLVVVRRLVDPALRVEIDAIAHA